MNTLTPSQIAQQYMYSRYPCIPQWMYFVQYVFVNLTAYDSTSCFQIGSICMAAMKTLDYIQQNEPNANVVRIMRLINDLYDAGWQGWTAFVAQSNISQGNRSITLSVEALQGITNFNAWDSALNTQPDFDPTVLLNTMLGGVTP